MIEARLPKVLGLALLVGAGFGTATALVNAAALGTVDLESREATTSGWSPAEVVSLLLDVGWAWAGLAVLTGWLATRAGNSPSGGRPLAHGAAAGVLSLLAATTAYAIAETIQDGGAVFSWQVLDPVWLVASVVFGVPLGYVGACAHRPGPIGLLAKVTVPIGAAAQMALMPPGRNEVLTTIGQVLVWTASAAAIAFTVIRFLGTERRRTSQGQTSAP